MSSSLRFIRSPSSPQPAPITRSTIIPPPQKKQKMSLTQTYYLAHTARGKLSKEASRADHDLRLLVGHANLLDGLMLDLADAEREQESWFNQTVKGATKASDERRQVQWADTIPEEAVEEENEEEEEEEEDEDDYAVEESWENGSSDDESDEDEEEIRVAPTVPVRRRSKPSVTISPAATEEDMEIDEDYEDDLALTRTSSHPPELLHESDSESDDEAMPPSPPQPERLLDAFSHKQRQAIVTTSFYQASPEPSSTTTAAASLPPSEQASFFDEGYYLPQRQHPAALVSAF